MKQDRTIKDIKINRIVDTQEYDNSINNSRRVNLKTNFNNSKKKFEYKQGIKNDSSFNNNDAYQGRMNNIDESSENMYRVNNVKNKKSIKNKILLWLMVILAIFFLFNILFHSAKINVEPKTSKIELKENVFAVNKYQKDDKNTVGEFYYNIDENNITEKKVPIKVAAFQEVEEKAKGKISIKNDTDKTVKLIKRTRFKRGDKVYRIQNTITIPKKSSKEVMVVADKTGELYNNSEKNQKYLIPGFLESKNNDSYKNIYGISTTSFKGGFSGKKPVPDKDDLKKEEDKITKEIKKEFKSIIDKKIKKTEDLYFENIAQENIESEIVVDGEKLFLVMNGSLIIPYIKKENFDEVVINKAIESDYVNGYLKKGGDFEYAFIDADGLDYKSGDNFKVKITGTKTAVWVIDKKRMAKRAKGSNKKDLIKEVKRDFPVENIDISIFPFWKNTLPTNIEKIEIDVSE